MVSVSTSGTRTNLIPILFVIFHEPNAAVNINLNESQESMPESRSVIEYTLRSGSTMNRNNNHNGFAKSGTW